MSTYIIPVYPEVDSVFSAINSITTIVKDGSGGVYWPSFGVNMIGNMVIGRVDCRGCRAVFRGAFGGDARYRRDLRILEKGVWL